MEKPREGWSVRALLFFFCVLFFVFIYWSYLWKLWFSTWSCQSQSWLFAVKPCIRLRACMLRHFELFSADLLLWCCYAVLLCFPLHDASCPSRSTKRIYKSNRCRLYILVRFQYQKFISKIISISQVLYSMMWFCPLRPKHAIVSIWPCWFVSCDVLFNGFYLVSWCMMCHVMSCQQDRRSYLQIKVVSIYWHAFSEVRHKKILYYQVLKSVYDAVYLFARNIQTLHDGGDDYGGLSFLSLIDNITPTYNIPD